MFICFYSILVFFLVLALRVIKQRYADKVYLYSLIIISIVYFILMVYYTFLTRQPSGNHQMDLDILKFLRKGIRFQFDFSEWFGTILNGNRYKVIRIHKGLASSAITNILMFIPMGIILSTFKMKNYGRLLVALLISCGIEILQYITTLGVFELDDLLCNELGALIGLYLYRGIINKGVKS